MATKKKSKTKRKKTTPKRPAIRKKPVKVTKKSTKVARKPAATKVAKKPARKVVPASPPPPPPPPGERIGVVTHYYGHLSVAVVKLEPGTTLRVGDNIHVKGHTTDFSQPVESLQVAHAPVSEVSPDDDFGLKVKDHVREHDIVYRVK
jgi:hypothetical protein